VHSVQWSVDEVCVDHSAMSSLTSGATTFFE
jgi:hypothetical protein